MNLEQQFTAKLVSSLERTQQFVEHVTDGFLRADVEKRGSFYVQAISNGWMTINEVRERENLPPLDGDDVARVPMNTEALEAAPSADEDDLVEPQGRKARRRRFASLSSTTTTTPSRSNSAPTPCCPRVRAWLAYIGSDASAAVAADAMGRAALRRSETAVDEDRGYGARRGLRAISKQGVYPALS